MPNVTTRRINLLKALFPELRTELDNVGSKIREYISNIESMLNEGNRVLESRHARAQIQTWFERGNIRLNENIFYLYHGDEPMETRLEESGHEPSRGEMWLIILTAAMNLGKVTIDKFWSKLRAYPPLEIKNKLSARDLLAVWFSLFEKHLCDPSTPGETLDLLYNSLVKLGEKLHTNMFPDQLSDSTDLNTLRAIHIIIDYVYTYEILEFVYNHSLIQMLNDNVKALVKGAGESFHAQTVAADIYTKISGLYSYATDENVGDQSMLYSGCVSYATDSYIAIDKLVHMQKSTTSLHDQHHVMHLLVNIAVSQANSMRFNNNFSDLPMIAWGIMIMKYMQISAQHDEFKTYFVGRRQPSLEEITNKKVRQLVKLFSDFFDRISQCNTQYSSTYSYALSLLYALLPQCSKSPHLINRNMINQLLMRTNRRFPGGKKSFPYLETRIEADQKQLRLKRDKDTAQAERAKAKSCFNDFMASEGDVTQLRKAIRHAENSCQYAYRDKSRALVFLNYLYHKLCDYEICSNSSGGLDDRGRKLHTILVEELDEVCIDQSLQNDRITDPVGFSKFAAYMVHALTIASVDIREINEMHILVKYWQVKFLLKVCQEDESIFDSMIAVIMYVSNRCSNKLVQETDLYNNLYTPLTNELSEPDDLSLKVMWDTLENEQENQMIKTLMGRVMQWRSIDHAFLELRTTLMHLTDTKQIESAGHLDVLHYSSYQASVVAGMYTTMQYGYYEEMYKKCIMATAESAFASYFKIGYFPSSYPQDLFVRLNLIKLIGFEHGQESDYSKIVQYICKLTKIQDKQPSVFTIHILKNQALHLNRLVGFKKDTSAIRRKSSNIFTGVETCVILDAYHKGDCLFNIEIARYLSGEIGYKHSPNIHFIDSMRNYYKFLLWAFHVNPTNPTTDSFALSREGIMGKYIRLAQHDVPIDHTSHEAREIMHAALQADPLILHQLNPVGTTQDEFEEKMKRLKTSLNEFVDNDDVQLLRDSIGTDLCDILGYGTPLSEEPSTPLEKLHNFCYVPRDSGSLKSLTRLNTLEKRNSFTESPPSIDDMELSGISEVSLGFINTLVSWMKHYEIDAIFESMLIPLTEAYKVHQRASSIPEPDLPLLKTTNTTIQRSHDLDITSMKGIELIPRVGDTLSYYTEELNRQIAIMDPPSENKFYRELNRLLVEKRNMKLSDFYELYHSLQKLKSISQDKQKLCPNLFLDALSLLQQYKAAKFAIGKGIFMTGISIPDMQAADINFFRNEFKNVSRYIIKNSPLNILTASIADCSKRNAGHSLLAILFPMAENISEVLVLLAKFLKSPLGSKPNKIFWGTMESKICQALFFHQYINERLDQLSTKRRIDKRGYVIKSPSARLEMKRMVKRYEESLLGTVYNQIKHLGSRVICDLHRPSDLKRYVIKHPDKVAQFLKSIPTQVGLGTFSFHDTNGMHVMSCAFKRFSRVVLMNMQKSQQFSNGLFYQHVKFLDPESNSDYECLLKKEIFSSTDNPTVNEEDRYLVVLLMYSIKNTMNQELCTKDAFELLYHTFMRICELVHLTTHTNNFIKYKDDLKKYMSQHYSVNDEYKANLDVTNPVAEDLDDAINKFFHIIVPDTEINPINRASFQFRTFGSQRQIFMSQKAYHLIRKTVNFDIIRESLHSPFLPICTKEQLQKSLDLYSDTFTLRLNRGMFGEHPADFGEMDTETLLAYEIIIKTAFAYVENKLHSLFSIDVDSELFTEIKERISRTVSFICKIPKGVQESYYDYIKYRINQLYTQPLSPEQFEAWINPHHYESFDQALNRIYSIFEEQFKDDINDLVEKAEEIKDNPVKHANTLYQIMCLDKLQAEQFQGKPFSHLPFSAEPCRFPSKQSRVTNPLIEKVSHIDASTLHDSTDNMAEAERAYALKYWLTYVDKEKLREKAQSIGLHFADNIKEDLKQKAINIAPMACEPHFIEDWIVIDARNERKYIVYLPELFSLKIMRKVTYQYKILTIELREILRKILGDGDTTPIIFVSDDRPSRPAVYRTLEWALELGSYLGSVYHNLNTGGHSHFSSLDIELDKIEEESLHKIQPYTQSMGPYFNQLMTMEMIRNYMLQPGSEEWFYHGQYAPLFSILKRELENITVEEQMCKSGIAYTMFKLVSFVPEQQRLNKRLTHTLALPLNVLLADHLSHIIQQFTTLCQNNADDVEKFIKSISMNRDMPHLAHNYFIGMENKLWLNRQRKSFKQVLSPLRLPPGDPEESEVIEGVHRIRDNGEPIESVVKSIHVTTRHLVIAGYTAAAMKKVGHGGTADLKKAYFNYAELKLLKVAEFTIVEIEAAGYNAAHAGFDIKDLHEAGYTPLEMREGGHSVKALKDFRYRNSDHEDESCYQDKDIMYPANHLVPWSKCSYYDSHSIDFVKIYLCDLVLRLMKFGSIPDCAILDTFPHFEFETTIDKLRMPDRETKYPEFYEKAMDKIFTTLDTEYVSLQTDSEGVNSISFGCRFKTRDGDIKISKFKVTAIKPLMSNIEHSRWLLTKLSLFYNKTRCHTLFLRDMQSSIDDGYVGEMRFENALSKEELGTKIDNAEVWSLYYKQYHLLKDSDLSNDDPIKQSKFKSDMKGRCPDGSEMDQKRKVIEEILVNRVRYVNALGDFMRLYDGMIPKFALSEVGYGKLIDWIKINMQPTDEEISERRALSYLERTISTYILPDKQTIFKSALMDEATDRPTHSSSKLHQLIHKGLFPLAHVSMHRSCKDKTWMNHPLPQFADSNAVNATNKKFQLWMLDIMRRSNNVIRDATPPVDQSLYATETAGTQLLSQFGIFTPAPDRTHAVFEPRLIHEIVSPP